VGVTEDLGADTVPLAPLPVQPHDVAWPSADGTWPLGETPKPARARLADLLAQAFAPSAPMGQTYAVVVVHRGAIVAERYGGALEHWEGPSEPVGPTTQLLSWSMAKSVLHAAVGILVGEQLLDLGSPAPVPEWQDRADPRHEIRLQDLLEMRDGLAWREDYVSGDASDVISMLFGPDGADVAAFASSRPLLHETGSVFNYSSGTSNIVAGVLRRTVGAGDEFRSWLRDRLWSRVGAGAVRLGIDEAGTWVASSYCYATAREYGRFGQLYLRDGMWDGERILPAGWVDHGRRPRSVDPEDGERYGAHWWVGDDEWGTFRASGYEGQSITVSPGLDLVVVRLGKTPAEQADVLARWRQDVVEAFAAR
jgi:CubicO group peptidase (beta-lactamase class C family)